MQKEEEGGGGIFSLHAAKGERREEGEIRAIRVRDSEGGGKHGVTEKIRGGGRKSE